MDEKKTTDACLAEQKIKEGIQYANYLNISLHVASCAASTL